MNLKKKLLKRLIILKTKRNQKIKIKKPKKNNKKEKINEEPYKNEIKELKNNDEFVKKQL